MKVILTIDVVTICVTFLSILVNRISEDFLASHKMY